jgi:hypothetical protein
MSSRRPTNYGAKPGENLDAASGKNYEVGYGRPPQEHRWKKGESGNPRRRYPARSLGTAQLIDHYLLSPVVVSEGGLSKKVPALKVIILQLWRQEIADHRQALVVRLKYEELARESAKRGVDIILVDSAYTRSLAAGQSPEVNDDE